MLKQTVYLTFLSWVLILPLIAQTTNTSYFATDLRQCDADALFTASNNDIDTGETVSFINSSSGGTDYQWAINNVPTSTSIDYTYTFSTSGSYYVCLMVSNETCSDIYCQTINVDFGAANGCQGSTFQKRYGGEADDEARSVKTTADGGFIAAGSTRSYGGGDNDALVFKTTADGTVEWAKKLGIPANDEHLEAIKITTDGGYIAAGNSRPTGVPPSCTGSPELVGIIWRIDANGNTLWMTKIDGNTNNGEYIYQITQTSTGDFVFVGSTNSGCTVVDAMVGKVDANGELIWCKRWTNDNGSSDWIADVIEDSAGNIAFIGVTRSYHGDVMYDNYHNFFVTKINGANGDLIWSNEYYGFNDTAGSNDAGVSIKILPSGNYVVSCNQTPLFSWSSAAEPTNSSILELTEAEGDIVWEKSFIFSATDQGVVGEVMYNPDNQQLAYAFNDASTIAGPVADGSIGIGTTTNVGIALNNTYLGYGFLYALDKVADEGYVISGYQVIDEQNDIYLGKVNNELLTPGCENTPIDIADTDNSFHITYTNWVISDAFDYVFPNQTATVEDVTLNEIGELCSTACVEICDNDIDDDGNGLIDENCPCPTLVLQAVETSCANEPVQLEAEVGFDTYQWTPTVGLNNPNIRNPIATPTESIDYTLTAKKWSHNKIINGDFSMENVGFASALTYSDIYAPCNYYVDSLWFGSALDNVFDHTPTNDNRFMQIGGCNETGVILWQQTIADISPNTDYQFSFWASRATLNPPAFDLHFIGNQTGDSLLATQTPAVPFTSPWQWDEYGIPVWNSGANTELTLRIISVQVGEFGDDFGLDDFSLRQICTSTATVPFNILSDSLVYQQHVSCTPGEIVVTAKNGLPPYNYRINGGVWVSSGSFEDLSAGTYQIETKDANDCIVQRTVTLDLIVSDINLSIVSIQPFDCNTAGAATLLASDPEGLVAQYELDDNILQSTPIFNNISAGLHQVEAIDEAGCVLGSIEFTIPDNDHPPYIDLGANQMFCHQENNLLDATTEGAISYLWSDGSTDAALQITETGIYSVTVTGTCGTDSDQVHVTVQSCGEACLDVHIIDAYTCNNITGTYAIYAGASGGTPPYAVTGATDISVLAENELFIVDDIPQLTPYIINVTDAAGCLKSVLLTPSCSVLPIELAQFTGTVLPKGNQLEWITAAEVNNDYFILQRSTDGQHFTNMAQIKGAGNANTTHSYSFLDRDISFGITYYKLQQIDFDGKTNHIGSVALQRNASNIHILSLAPVPTNSQLHINFYTPTNQSITIELFDVVGRIVYQKMVAAEMGNNQELIDVSAYPSGVYMLQIGNGSDTQFAKVIVK